MTAKENVEKLMDELIPFARKMIAIEGEFYPYGGFINATGEIVHVGVEKDDEYPSSAEMENDLQATFYRMAKSEECIATAIVANVRVIPPGEKKAYDAIRASLNHSNGYSALIFLPYVVSESGVEYFQLFAHKGENITFKSAAIDTTEEVAE